MDGWIPLRLSWLLHRKPVVLKKICEWRWCGWVGGWLAQLVAPEEIDHHAHGVSLLHHTTPQSAKQRISFLFRRISLYIKWWWEKSSTFATKCIQSTVHSLLLLPSLLLTQAIFYISLCLEISRTIEHDHLRIWCHDCVCKFSLNCSACLFVWKYWCLVAGDGDKRVNIVQHLEQLCSARIPQLKRKIWQNI